MHPVPPSYRTAPIVVILRTIPAGAPRGRYGAVALRPFGSGVGAGMDGRRGLSSVRGAGLTALPRAPALRFDDSDQTAKRRRKMDDSAGNRPASGDRTGAHR